MAAALDDAQIVRICQAAAVPLDIPILAQHFLQLIPGNVRHIKAHRAALKAAVTQKIGKLGAVALYNGDIIQIQEASGGQLHIELYQKRAAVHPHICHALSVLHMDPFAANFRQRIPAHRAANAVIQLKADVGGCALGFCPQVKAVCRCLGSRQLQLQRIIRIQLRIAQPQSLAVVTAVHDLGKVCVLRLGVAVPGAVPSFKRAVMYHIDIGHIADIPPEAIALQVVKIEVITRLQHQVEFHFRPVIFRTAPYTVEVRSLVDQRPVGADGCQIVG